MPPAIDGITAGARDVQSQRTADDADVLVEVDLILLLRQAVHRPVVMTDERRSQGVESKQGG